MRSTEIDVREFFDSFIWEDIRDILQEGIDLGTKELMSPKLTEINDINRVRGKLENLLNLRDSLEEIMLERIQLRQEEEKPHGKRSEEDEADSDFE